MTSLDQPRPATEPASAPTPAEPIGAASGAARHRPRRGLTGRLSTGHLVMLLAGIATVLANYAVLRGAEERVEVLVADQALAAGTVLTPEHVATAEVGAGGTVPSRLVAGDRRDEVVGAVLTGPLQPGDPLRRSDLQPAAAPDGQRAMSVPVDAAHAVGGQLARGDRVDVLATFDGRSRYLVTDAEVLAVPGRGGLDSLRGFSVTLAVDGDAALQLAEALRSGDVDVVRATGADPIEGAGR